MIDKYKIGIAILFAIIAALTAMIAGLVSDVRITIVLLRTLACFLVTGVLVYIGAFLFDRISYKGSIDETEKAMMELEEQEKQENGIDEDGSEENQEASSEQDGFQPLEADSLKRVVTDEQDTH